MTWHSKLSGDACQREFESHPSLLLLPSARNCTPGWFQEGTRAWCTLCRTTSFTTKL